MEPSTGRAAGSSTEQVAKGLEGILVAETRIGFIDGEKGELLYRGHSIADLAGHVSFEEAAALLWSGELPGKDEREALAASLAAARALPPGVLDVLRALPRGALPVDVLRTLVSLLASYDREASASTPEANARKAIRLAGELPTGLAAFHRIRSQLPVLDPRPDLGHSSSFLWMALGEAPDRLAARVFETALVLHMEHGLNASTFAARVTASTLADLHAAVTSAAAALKGPLHGGANEQVMVMLEEVGAPARAADYVRSKLARKEKIMGFGHRVYRTEDPRATVLRRMAEELTRARDVYRLFEISRAIEEAVAAEVGQKGIAPNVDFYSATVYHALGIPHDLFTPIFALARVVGWTAHVIEQYADNRLIRPGSRYVGPSRRPLPAGG